MNPPFPPLDRCVMGLLQENYDRNGKHMEYRDVQGVVFATMAKVYHKTGLFGLFNADNYVHGELKDSAGNLLMTTASYRGETKPECKVEIHHADGTLFGVLRDAHYGADFETPDGTVIGKARRAEDRPTEPIEVIHTFLDAADQPIGTCDRCYPDKTNSLLDFLVYGSTYTGQPVQQIVLTAPVEPTLHTFLFLFPALQHLRYSRSEYSSDASDTVASGRR